MDLEEKIKNFCWRNSAIKVRGSEIPASDFISSFITLKTQKKIAEHFGITPYMVGTIVKRDFPELPTDTTTYKNKILYFFEYKECIKCKHILPYGKFSLDKQQSSNRQPKCKECQKTYYKDNREYVLEKNKKYHRDNPEVGRTAAAKRRASKLQRTPVWAELAEIKELYKNCPEGYHVDHIIPLQGDKVSGFHVLSNLQYLPAQENISKSNKYEVEVVKNNS